MRKLLDDIRPHSFLILARFLPFPGTRLNSTIFRYSHWFDPFSVLTRIVFRYSHGFYLFPVLARILPFFVTHTDSTFFRYSFGQFFGTRSDSTFSRYSPGFYHFLVLSPSLPFFGTRRRVFRYLHLFYLFPVLARILPCFVTHTNLTLFRYLPGQFFGTRSDDMNDFGSHKLRDIDAMNNSWLWMIWMILDHELKALDVIKNSRLLMRLTIEGWDHNVVNAMNSSNCWWYEPLRVVCSWL